MGLSSCRLFSWPAWPGASNGYSPKGAAIPAQTGRSTAYRRPSSSPLLPAHRRLAERACDLICVRDVLLAGLPVEWLARMKLFSGADAVLRSAQLQLLLHCTDQEAEALAQDQAWLAEGLQVRGSRRGGRVSEGDEWWADEQRCYQADE